MEQQLSEYVGVKHCITVASGTDSLEIALRKFDEGGHASLPVLKPGSDDVIEGNATQNAALASYNKALVATSEEEHKA